VPRLQKLLHQIKVGLGAIRTALPPIRRDLEEIAVQLLLFAIFCFGIWYVVWNILLK